MPVVTQASQLSEEFDPVSTPKQQRSIHNLEEDLMDFQEEHILEHANIESTPIMAPSSTIAYFPTPTNSLPDTSKKRMHSVMDSTTISNKERAAAARSMVSLANSTGKK